jgi:hypothetical protein
MRPPSTTSRIISYVTLLVALAFLAVGGWLLWSYWRGAGTDTVVPLSNDAVASIAGGANNPNRPIGRPVPPLALIGKGVIGGRGGAGGYVNAGEYRMTIRDPAGSVAPDIRFFVARVGAFTGPDADLINLVARVAADPITDNIVGASLDQVTKIKDTLGPRLQNERLKVDDASAASCAVLWTKYVAAGMGLDHESLGTQLIELVGATCKAALPASEPDLQATITDVRQLVPPEQESAWRAALEQDRQARAARRSATRPSTRPTRPRLPNPLTTGPSL